MERSLFAVLASCILLSSTAGCRRLEEAFESSKTSSPSISMATVRRPDGIASADAEHMIAVARCSREAACGKIRGREPKSGREQCERQAGKQLHAELASCDAIPRDALDECLGEVGATDCDTSFDAATARIAACRAATLCAH